MIICLDDWLYIAVYQYVQQQANLDMNYAASEVVVIASDFISYERIDCEF